MLAVLSVAFAFAGPPKLPPLPTRGMRTVEAPAKTPEPEPKPEPAPEPAPKPKPEPKAKPDAAPYLKGEPQPSPEPTVVNLRPDPEPKRAPKPKPKATATAKAGTKSKAAEPLPQATEAELAALAADPPEPAKPKQNAGSHEGDVAVVRTATEAPKEQRLTFRRRPHPPTRSAAFIFGYRQFALVDALERRQSWHFVSIEVTPIRRYVRLNLLTEIGLEGGEAARAGDRADVMLIQKAGIGVQYPHWVTPFVEFQAGIGGARIELFERNDLVLVYTLGIDAGAQWAVTRWLFIHAAIGWIRPVLRQPTGTVRYDRFAFKVGLGF